MTSQGVFLAAFLGSTIGVIALMTLRITVIQPLIQRAKTYIQEHRAELAQGDPELAKRIRDCKCCVCGDLHKSIYDRAGTVIDT